MDEARMRSLMTPKMQRRIDSIEEVRRLRPTVSQHDAVRALNAARDDVSLACRLLPQVCEDSARRREAARRRQRDMYAEIDFLEGDEVMVRGLQNRAELNGGLGVVQRFHAKKGRYIVLLEQTRTTVAVKGINLEPLDDGGLADQESSAESDSSEEEAEEAQDEMPSQAESSARPVSKPEAQAALASTDYYKRLSQADQQVALEMYFDGGYAKIPAHMEQHTEAEPHLRAELLQMQAEVFTQTLLPEALADPSEFHRLQNSPSHSLWDNPVAFRKLEHLQQACPTSTQTCAQCDDAGPPDQHPESEPELEPAAVIQWDELQVCEWAEERGLGEVTVAALRKGEVDGAALVDLSAEEIRDELGLKLGKRKALQRAIAALSSSGASIVASSEATTEAQLLQRHRRQRLLARPVSRSGSEMDVTISDISEVLAMRVQPGVALANFAMVCRGWWHSARVLPAYCIPWDYEYQAWRQTGSQRLQPGSQVFPNYMNAALECQLARHLRRLPELEPDLRSAVLVEHAACYNVRLASHLGKGDDELCKVHQEEEEQLMDMFLHSRQGREPQGARRCRRNVLRNTIRGISDAAYRRLARLGGVDRFSSILYDTARSALRSFLEPVLHASMWYTQYSLQRTVTTTVAAHALRLHGWQSCSLLISSHTSFYDRKPQSEDKSENDGVHTIEEDDLDRPLPHSQIEEYLVVFASLHREVLQDYASDVVINKAADVLLRRAAESFLVQVTTFEMPQGDRPFIEVFTKASEDITLDALSADQQKEAFASSARVIVDGMHLHASCCAPPQWELDEPSIATWCKINADARAGIQSGDLMEVASEDEDDAYEAEHSEGSDDEDDLYEEEYEQQCEDYDLGFDCGMSDGEEFSYFRTAVNRAKLRELTDGSVTVDISVPELAPRFACYSAGRADRDEAQLHRARRWEAEERFEELSAGFSAAPKAARIYELRQ